MAEFQVRLSVMMEAETPAEAAEAVAEMAGGWSYEVYNFDTSELFDVHLDNDNDPQTELVEV